MWTQRDQLFFSAVLVSQPKGTCWTILTLISIQKIHRWFMLDYGDLHNHHFDVTTSLSLYFSALIRGLVFLIVTNGCCLTGWQADKVNRHENEIFLCFPEWVQCHVGRHCSAILLAVLGWGEGSVYDGTQESYIILSWTVLLRFWSTNLSLQWNFTVTFLIKVVSVTITKHCEISRG